MPFHSSTTRSVPGSRSSPSSRSNEKRLVIHVQGTGVFTSVADPSLTVDSVSALRIVFNYADNTFHHIGIYRNVTANQGNILHQTGRWVETLDFDGTILAVNGPHDEWLGELDDFCAALGG